MTLSDGIPDPPDGSDVLRIVKQRIEWPGLPPMRVSGWLAPPGRCAPARCVVEWFLNGNRIGEEPTGRSLFSLYGVIALSDDQGFFGRKYASNLFHDSTQARVKEWLRSWVLRHLQRQHDPGDFLRGWLDTPGFDLALLNDQAWLDLIHRHCPFPTTDRAMTLERIVQAQRAEDEILGVSIWTPELAGTPPGGRGPGPLAVFRDQQDREVAEACLRELGLSVSYVDQRSYGRDQYLGLSRGERDHLEDLFIAALRACRLSFVDVEISADPGFTEDARLYRGSVKHRENWLEHSVLQMRADSPTCMLLRQMEDNAVRRSLAPILVFESAYLWCTESLGGTRSPFRQGFWPRKHEQLRYIAGISAFEAEQRRNQVSEQTLQAARDAFHGKPLD